MNRHRLRFLAPKLDAPKNKERQVKQRYRKTKAMG